MKGLKFWSILMFTVFTVSMQISCSSDNDKDIETALTPLSLTKENLIGGWQNEMKDIIEVYVFRSSGKGNFTYFVNQIPHSLMSYTFDYNIKDGKLVLSNLVNYEDKPIKGDMEYFVNITKDRLELIDVTNDFSHRTYKRDNFWAK